MTTTPDWPHDPAACEPNGTRRECICPCLMCMSDLCRDAVRTAVETGGESLSWRLVGDGEPRLPLHGDYGAPD